MLEKITFHTSAPAGKTFLLLRRKLLGKSLFDLNVYSRLFVGITWPAIDKSYKYSNFILIGISKTFND